MSNKKKSFQKNKQQKLEQELASAYRRERQQERTRIIKAVLVGILSIMLILSFCFPSVMSLLSN